MTVTTRSPDSLFQVRSSFVLLRPLTPLKRMSKRTR